MDSLGGRAAFTRWVIACCYDFMDFLRASAPPRESIAGFRFSLKTAVEKKLPQSSKERKGLRTKKKFTHLVKLSVT